MAACRTSPSDLIGALDQWSANSIGTLSLATQGGAGNLESNIAGALGTLTVETDL